MQIVVSDRKTSSGQENRQETKPTSTSTIEPNLEEEKLPSAKTSTDPHQALAKELQHGVYHARRFGHSIELNTLVHPVEISESLKLDCKIEKLYSTYGLEGLKQAGSISAEFMANDRVRVSPFGVTATPSVGGGIDLTIKNYLLPGNPTVFQTTVVTPPTFEPSRLSEMLRKVQSQSGEIRDTGKSSELNNLEELLGKLRDEYAPILEREINSLEQKIEALSPDPDRLFRGRVRLTIEQGRSENQDSALGSLSQSGVAINLSAELHDSNGNVNFVLPIELLKQNPGSRLLVDGEVSRVETETKSVNQIIPTASPVELAQQFAKLNTQISQTTDEYGNIVSILRYCEPSDSIKSTTTTVTKVFLSRAADLIPLSGHREVVTGAAQLGVPQLTGLVLDSEGLAIPSKDEVGVVILDSQLNLSEQQLQTLDGFKRGASDALKEYGLEGSVSRIFVSNAASANAMFRKTDPNALFVNDELLNENEIVAKRVGYHEAVHLIDARHRNPLSAGRVEKEWSGLKSPKSSAPFIKPTTSSFFGKLDESSFFQDGIGGHSADNPEELVASFAVSLTHNDWEQKLSSSSLQFQREYLTVLQAYKSQIEASQLIAPEAPIRDSLATKEISLQKIIQETESKQRGQARMPTGLSELFEIGGLGDLKLPPVPKRDTPR